MEEADEKEKRMVRGTESRGEWKRGSKKEKGREYSNIERAERNHIAAAIAHKPPLSRAMCNSSS